MNKESKDFRKRYKVEGLKGDLQEYIREEQIKIRTDKSLSDKQKKERLIALEELYEELNGPQAIIRRKDEEVWEK